MTDAPVTAQGPLFRTLVAIAALVLLAITLPLAVTAVTAFNATSETAFPPNGYSLRWFANIVQQRELVAAFWFSLGLAVSASVLTICLATLTALALQHGRFPGRDLLEGIFLSPLIVPQVIAGLAFLIFFSRWSPGAGFVNFLLLHTLLTFPYGVRLIRSSLERLNPRLEEAAFGLGAGPVRAFWLVTLPQIRPSLLVATFFAFVVSFDNFTATAFLAADEATLPVAIYAYIDSSLDPTISAISALLILATSVFVIVADRIVGVQRIV